MKSFYGNLVVDIFELIFAFVSLLLVWISCAKDSTIFFGISTAIYMMPRLLSIVVGMLNNGRDVIRFLTDIISMVTLIISFIIVSLIMFDYVVGVFGEDFNLNHIKSGFYVLSAISLIDIVFKVVVGIVQKLSITIRNSKSNLILGGN